ncbi:hypothetical protein [Sphingobium cloacae]|uniref:Uncharacterized protein n=1 Tax=Sphingobium cloacae TaxID=120107 RepID=A0A1E1F2Q8_9SPHN|nr:hypothetical protein [Sphingobium cloacae]BAV64795.1 hypothetical protein SCLO_1017550 [Sphingobium cloacae]
MVRVEGFAIVPVIPTAAMIAAGSAESSIASIWTAMVATVDQVPDAVVVEDVLAPFRAMRVRLSAPRGCDVPAETLAALPPLGRVRRNPDFWGDLEVRRLVIELHRQVTIDCALAMIEARVGAERTPSKSALGRAWKRLDLHTKSKRRGSR